MLLITLQILNLNLILIFLMKLTVSILLLFSFYCLAVNGQIIKDSLPNYGNEKKESTFFRERYQHNDLVHYLDNMSDFVTYESETTGFWKAME